MKKRFFLFLIAGAVTTAQLGASTDCECDCDFTGKTFFSARPQYQSGMPEKLTLWRDRMNTREDGRGGAFQLAFFGGRSSQEENLRHWFFPECKNKLEAKLNLTEEFTFEDMDVIAEHFRVLTTSGKFESSIRMCPRQSVFGIGLTYRQSVSSIGCADDEDRDYDWWFEISSPLMRIKNDLRFDEKVAEDGGGVNETPVQGLPEDHEFMANMEDAFKQKAWKFGKIGDCKKDLTKWRLADIELKFGFEWDKEDMCHLEAYFGVLIPTGNRPTAEFLFEPIVGHNKHWGITKGGAAYFQVWDDEEEDKHLQFTWNWHGMYLFSRNECRSFDVKCKPWSRYMSVYADIDQAREAARLGTVGATQVAGRLLDSPGINFFTKDLKVKPRLSANTTTAVIYTNDERGFRGEVGYSLFARQKECVSLCEWNETVAFRRRQSGAGVTVPYPYERIDTRGTRWKYQGGDLFLRAGAPIVPGGTGVSDQEYEDSIIKEEDLDLESAAHPAVFSHTFYLSLGKRWDDRDYPLYLGGGGSYELGGTNAGMNRWLLWLKGGVSF